MELEGLMETSNMDLSAKCSSSGKGSCRNTAKVPDSVAVPASPTSSYTMVLPWTSSMYRKLEIFESMRRMQSLSIKKRYDVAAELVRHVNIALVRGIYIPKETDTAQQALLEAETRLN
ncbi:hypothetical protein CEXT_712081 [Caerostris extrusa]|uniref:Uncharacterized protein n=1 Tax=Caerostris extrusa TaxID=172846 RepID=A0AAV4QN38_CAEEX|nr:hypothetical protein CEXT_712081 [Caerostris extrusa]